jgi:hypothetical protein
MCRYAMYGPYKRHFACFSCRKGFKRAALARDEDAKTDPAPCPDCGAPTANMGLDFKPPRKSAVEHWEVVEFLFRRGLAYHSCGCDGPGYRPSRWVDVAAFLDMHRRRPAGEVLAAKFAARELVGPAGASRGRSSGIRRGGRRRG